MHTLRSAGLGLVALVGILVAAGSGGEARPSVAPSPDGHGVRIHRACRYKGIGDLEPRPGMQDVAVDVEVGPSVDIDPDDVEILDAATGETLEPAIVETAYLRPDGRLLSWRHPPEHGPVRMLFIFRIPQHVKAILLEHQGRFHPAALDALNRGEPSISAA